MATSDLPCIFLPSKPSFMNIVYSNLLIFSNHRGFYNSFSDKTINFSEVERTPKWINANGSCFDPFEEQCNITLATIALWALLLTSTAVLLAKETFQVSWNFTQWVTFEFSFLFESKNKNVTIIFFRWCIHNGLTSQIGRIGFSLASLSTSYSSGMWFSGQPQWAGWNSLQC